MWNRIRKIKEKESTNSIHHLSVNDRDVTSHRDIANALADNVSHNSSSAFSTDAFASVRKVHNWFIKGCGMYCSVYGKVHIKDPLLLIEKSSLCGGFLLKSVST